MGNTLFQKSTLDILLTISNFSTTCQLTVIRVLVDCQLKICLTLYFVGPPTDIQLTISNLATTSKLILLTHSLTPNHNLTVYYNILIL